MRKVDLLVALNIERGAVVSIVGAGGKTSLMFYLAREAVKIGMRVLVTTSTRIFVPSLEQYDFIDLSGAGFLASDNKKGIYVCGQKAEPGKMKGISSSLLIEHRGNFDLIIIEADGSKQKPLKAWAQHEPVVYDFTTHTVGVIDIRTIGQELNDEHIHRLAEFKSDFCNKEDCLITKEHLEIIMTSGKGIFAKAVGEKFIFFNKVEEADHFESVKKMRDKILDKNIVAGSLKREKFYA
ncbi:MAG: selenium cofactor biosynthesis protein YqeC [Desulfotalea sp.]